eukprot:SAG11_NODE_1518_length_4761_cov_2.905405_6_plen_73_part_00
MILLLFDANKLDIGDEFHRAILALKGTAPLFHPVQGPTAELQHASTCSPSPHVTHNRITRTGTIYVTTQIQN